MNNSNPQVIINQFNINIDKSNILSLVKSLENTNNIKIDDTTEKHLQKKKSTLNDKKQTSKKKCPHKRARDPHKRLVVKDTNQKKKHKRFYNLPKLEISEDKEEISDLGDGVNIYSSIANKRLNEVEIESSYIFHYKIYSDSEIPCFITNQLPNNTKLSLHFFIRNFTDKIWKENWEIIENSHTIHPSNVQIKKEVIPGDDLSFELKFAKNTNPLLNPDKSNVYEDEKHFFSFYIGKNNIEKSDYVFKIGFYVWKIKF